MKELPFEQQFSLFAPLDYRETQTIEQNINMFESKEAAVDYYFRAYREMGYPNYDISQYDPESELAALRRIDSSAIIKDGVAVQTMLGCGFLWCFFPHWIDCKTFNDGSLRDNWEDDAKLRNMMEKTVDWCLKHESGRMSTNRVRQLAKVYLCKQAPSNFRPTVSKAIYDIYGNHGNVYDPCGGWGGRLFGFLASDCREYVCCDPSTLTANGLNELYDKCRGGVHKSVIINCECQEDYKPKCGHFDLVFTSPPYFDCERYSDEPTQSYIRYPTVIKWCAGFLEPLISNAYDALKPGGRFVLNIANTKNAPQLEELSLIFADMAGFKLEDTLKLTLSSIAGKGVKYEPMFVFKKAGDTP